MCIQNMITQIQIDKYKKVDRKTQELSNVFEIIELLDQVKLSQQEKDDITMDFLIRKYLSDDDKLQKYMNEYQEQNKDKLEIQVQQQIRIKKSQNQMSRFDNLDHLNLQDVQKKIREEQNQKQNERIIVEKIKFLQAQKDQKDHEDEIFQKKMQRRDQNGLSFKLQSKINELDKKKNTIYNQNESFELKASHVRMPSGGLLSSTQNHNFNQLKSKKTSLIEDSHKLIRTNEKIQKNFSFIDNLNTIQSNLKPQFSMTDQFKQQNKKFVKNLVKSYSINSFKPNNLVMDVKYKPGESIRTMKIIQSGQEMRFQALSQNIYGASNEILQKNMKIHKDLKGAKQIQNQLIIQEKRRKSQMNNINQEVNQLDISGDDSDRQINLQNKKAKIITNKRFMSNPKKNLQMTLIKSNNNYYVLDL